MIRPLATLALVLAVAGCQRTLFESPPVAAADGCDADLVGEWRSEGDRRSEDGELVAFVGDDCSLTTVEHGSQGERRSPPTTLHVGRAGGVRYFWVDAAWANDSFKVDTGALDKPGDVYLYAYAISRDVLRVAAPPHTALAHRVLDKDVPGEIFMTENELVVRVTGDSAAVRGALARHRIFRMDQALRFRRAPEAR